MKNLLTLSLALLAFGVISGCGDPPPSTTLAPDKPMPDPSAMSAKDIAADKAKEHEGGRN